MSKRKKKPYALKAADDLDSLGIHAYAGVLRRLHSVNAELLEALKELLAMPDYDGTAKTSWKRSKAKHKARAAIAKAEEVKP